MIVRFEGFRRAIVLFGGSRRAIVLFWDSRRAIVLFGCSRRTIVFVGVFPWAILFFFGGGGPFNIQHKNTTKAFVVSPVAVLPKLPAATRRVEAKGTRNDRNTDSIIRSCSVAAILIYG